MDWRGHGIYFILWAASASWVRALTSSVFYKTAINTLNVPEIHEFNHQLLPYGIPIVVYLDPQRTIVDIAAGADIIATNVVTSALVCSISTTSDLEA